MGGGATYLWTGEGINQQELTQLSHRFTWIHLMKKKKKVLAGRGRKQNGQDEEVLSGVGFEAAMTQEARNGVARRRWKRAFVSKA